MYKNLIIIIWIFFFTIQISGLEIISPEYAPNKNDFIYLPGNEDSNFKDRMNYRTFSVDLSKYERIEEIELIFDYLDADQLLGFSIDMINLKIVINNQLIEQLMNTNYNRFETYKMNISHFLVRDEILNIVLQQNENQINYDGILIKNLHLSIKGIKR